MSKRGRTRRGRGESSIYEKTRRWTTSDGSVHEKTQWIAVVSEGHDPKDGRRRRKFLYADSKQEAQRELYAYLAKHGGSAPRATERSTFADFVGRFIADVKSNRSANTARSYEQVLRLHVMPSFQAFRLDQIDSTRVQRLYSDLRRDNVSASLVARVHVTLRRLLNVAKRQGLIDTSPLERVEAPRYKRPPAKSMTLDQVGRFLEATRNDRLEALFILACTTGMRQGELFGLQWDNVDFKQRSLSVRYSVEEIAGELTLIEPKTSTSRRRIELSKMALDALKRRRALANTEQHESDYVFPTLSGTALRKSNFLRRVYYPLRTMAKIPASVPFHALRHTAASMLLLQGVSPRVVQEMLGHADIRLTLGTYSHVLPTLQRQAADSLDALLTATKEHPREATIVGTSSVQGQGARSTGRKKSP